MIEVRGRCRACEAPSYLAARRKPDVMGQAEARRQVGKKSAEFLGFLTNSTCDLRTSEPWSPWAGLTLPGA